jgi:hypothetical protein
MRNGSHNMHTYRADHSFPRSEAKRCTGHSPSKRVFKKHHHKKQRSWDKKLIKQEE